jgi:hypothetical protein
MDRIRERSLITRKHQTPGKIMGTKHDTRPMGPHDETVAVPEQRPTLRQ